MKKCKIKKDPCKICHETVTKKNGVQCQGACKKLFHFDCLNYTPGKIRDIRNGIIKIMCPCPDCDSEPKEVLVNPPYTCQNQKCPANAPRRCESADCPLNKSAICSKDECPRNVMFDKCEPVIMPPCDTGQQYPPPCSPPPCRPPPPPPCRQNNSEPPPKCPAGQCSSEIEDLQQILQPRASNTSIDDPCKMKSQSCCCVSKGAGSANLCQPPTPSKSLSDSRIFGNKKKDSRYGGSMECALKQMCETVGLLTEQIKDLMCKIMDKSR